MPEVTKRKRPDPRLLPQLCFESAGAGREPARDREAARPQPDPDHGALCASGAGFGQGLGEAARAHIAALPRPRDPDAFLFPRHVEGRRIWILTNCWRTACADAKLGRLRLHDLRHSAVSQAVMVGENLPLVGKLLGHRRHRKTAGLPTPTWSRRRSRSAGSLQCTWGCGIHCPSDSHL